MAEERFDKHDAIHHQLFDEDTNQIGSLGDIVEKHAGDAMFLTPAEKSPNDIDGGEADFEAEMLETDPAPNTGMDEADLYSAEDEDETFSTDQSGTVPGIARGFGTHLPQDIGRDGFQVESIPDQALHLRTRPLADGEELDDYDDDTSASKDDAKGKLAAASQPFTHMVSEDPDNDSEPTPGRIPVRKRQASSTDDELDASGAMK
ncbi:MAG: hypothetical protein ACRYFS_00975 [Janthinobacterium lividum]